MSNAATGAIRGPTEWRVVAGETRGPIRLPLPLGAARRYGGSVKPVGHIEALLEAVRQPREVRWEPDTELLEMARALQDKATARERLLRDALDNIARAAAADREALVDHIRTGGAPAAVSMIAAPSRRANGETPIHSGGFMRELSSLGADVDHLRSRLRDALPHVFGEFGARSADGPEVAVVDAALGLLQLHLVERIGSLSVAALAWDVAPPPPRDVDETIRFLYEAGLSDAQIAKVVGRSDPALVEETRRRLLDKEGPLDEDGKPWATEVLDGLVAKRVRENVTRRRKDLGLKKDAKGRPATTRRG
jgi:hypothetical protein